jgi:transcriptional regulator with XRE-family HTH domain
MMEGVKTWIARQVRALREQRDWSQEDLGRETGKPQSAISRVEDPDYGKLTLQTLFDLAQAYDLPLLVQFVEWGDWLSRMNDVSTEVLQKESFSADALRDLGTGQIFNEPMQQQFVIDPFGQDQNQRWNFTAYPAANVGAVMSILTGAMGTSVRTGVTVSGSGNITVCGDYEQAHSIFEDADRDQDRDYDYDYDYDFEGLIRVPTHKVLEITGAENG